MAELRDTGSITFVLQDILFLCGFMGRPVYMLQNVKQNYKVIFFVFFAWQEAKAELEHFPIAKRNIGSCVVQISAGKIHEFQYQLDRNIPKKDYSPPSNKLNQHMLFMHINNRYYLIFYNYFIIN